MVALQLIVKLMADQNDSLPIDLNKRDLIEMLRTEVAKQSDVSSDEILLMFCGQLLKGTDTVEEAGVSEGDSIHCIRCKASRVDEAAPLSTLESVEVHRDLARLMRSKNRHAFIIHMQSNTFFTNAQTAVPAAWRAPEALFLLSDPAMLHNYYRSTPDDLSKILSERPVLGRMLQHILAEYRKQSTWTPHSPLPTVTSAFSLDALYEPEEDDHYTPRTRPSTHSSGAAAAGASWDGPVGLPAITPAQLAAALANATNAGSGRRGPPQHSLQAPHRAGTASNSSIPGTPFNTPASRASRTPSASATPSSASASHTPASASASTPQQQLPTITSEMLNSALLSAIGAATPASTRSQTSAAAPPSGDPEPSIPNMEESLRLMADMGIPDETLSRQALVATNGDLQAAVDLVFAQLNMFD